MHHSNRLAQQHLEVSRRYFLRLGAMGAAGLSVSPMLAADPGKDPALAKVIAELEYLTCEKDFGNVGRGKPVPGTLPPEKLREVGLTPETWKLEVIADPESNSKIDRPLTKEAGTALDWQGLMKLAEKHAVSYLKVMTCNNGAAPLGMGLWEGVPLREVLWMAQPKSNVRRVFFFGYHNDDPKQLFQSSLPIGRALEDPPGEHPVMLCYKFNGELLAPQRGAPVRLLAPDAYGFKSIKWLQRIVLTNGPAANDTYARGNNDIDSWMKTFARFLDRPSKIKAGQPVPVTGLAQVGISGLKKVQIWISPQDAKLPANDPFFTKANWRDVEILPPPSNGWGGGLPDGKLPSTPLGFDSKGRPRNWPMRYAIAHWATLLTDIGPGKYYLRCRTIDANGVAQPMPRPFRKSGRNVIHEVPLTVEA